MSATGHREESASQTYRAQLLCDQAPLVHVGGHLLVADDAALLSSGCGHLRGEGVAQMEEEGRAGEAA